MPALAVEKKVRESDAAATGWTSIVRVGEIALLGMDVRTW